MFILVFFFFFFIHSSEHLQAKVYSLLNSSTYFVKGQKENGSKVAVWEVLQNLLGELKKENLRGETFQTIFSAAFQTIYWDSN